MKALIILRQLCPSDVVLTALIRWTFILGILFLTVGSHLQ